MMRLSLPNIETSLRRKLLFGAGYVGFFLFFFFLFAYWTFPYDRLRDWIVQQVESPTGPGGQRQASGWELEIVDLSPSWLTGVTLEGVRLVKLPDGPEQQPMDLTIESVYARASLLGLLAGSTDLSFETVLAGGSIEGELELSEARTSIDADIRQVDLRQLQLLRAYVGLPLSGVATGQVDLTVSEDLSQTGGQVELDIEGMKIGDGNAKLQLPGMSDGLTVEQMEAGDLALRIGVEEGVAKIEKLEARGKDAELDGSGTVRLLKPLRMSRLDMMLRVKINDSYRNKSDRTRALFSLMEFNPRLREARTSDDALQWRINGSFGGRIESRGAGKAPAP